jgi:riboflavin-specific deaminase-like protein
MVRPLVTLHFAQSLDGRIGLGAGHARAILSTEEGLASAHRARAEHDAVLVGIETVLHDDPLLTARTGDAVQPLRVVLDSTLRLPLAARLLTAPGSAGSAGRVVVFGVVGAPAERKAALEAAGALVLTTAADASGRVDLPQMLDTLGRQGVRRLLVEGGGQVLTSFLLARAAERAEIEIAPCFLGAPGTPAVGALGVSGLGQALRLEQLQVERLVEGLLLRGEIVYPTAGSL